MIYIIRMINHYLVMFVIMIFSGLLSTMNVWVNKISDIRFSINDVYMTLLMTGWMFLFMGICYREFNIFMVGLFLVIVIIFCIRTQLFVSLQRHLLMSPCPRRSTGIKLITVLKSSQTNKLS
jgi:hypothetical protein